MATSENLGTRSIVIGGRSLPPGTYPWRTESRTIWESEGGREQKPTGTKGALAGRSLQSDRTASGNA
ncbi:hypothetical protein TRAPUB_6788 [Trametes pubescens]|uniref:Uncharacterized protein n=1 Tax=Trametes pubescens TaxID=154538 RepID=A0A1M2V599_TRAPU|nr:hypothetical protein TRAPUB_6788 [Trametes pubescens]